MSEPIPEATIENPDVDHLSLASEWAMEADRLIREAAYLSRDEEGENGVYLGYALHVAGLHAQIAQSQNIQRQLAVQEGFGRSLEGQSQPVAIYIDGQAVIDSRTAGKITHTTIRTEEQ